MALGPQDPDDIRMFIKNEPHKLSKIQTGQLRLIMAMSLEDQVVDRILMSTWQKAETNYFAVPGKTGWTPIPFGYKYFNRVFSDNVLATDCSSFDWTFPGWVAQALLEMRISLMRNPSDRYVAILRNRWAQAIGPRAIIRLPDGSRYQQKFWGLMKSGWFRTIAENSSAQVFINMRAWNLVFDDFSLPEMWSMGDDVLLEWSGVPEGTIAKFEEALATTGILVKSSSREREFGGFRIGRHTVTPLYSGKHAFTLRYARSELRAEVATCYTLLYALADCDFVHTVRARIEPDSNVPWKAAKLWAQGLLRLEHQAFPE